MKIAVVTGTSYGLGKSICEELLKNDFKVYGISRTKPPLNHIQFAWIKADLTNTSDINFIGTSIQEDHIDLLVNNAGHVFPLKTLDYTDDDFETMFGLNFKAPIKITCELFPKLDKGLIINISSDSDRFPDPDLALYGSSKAALNIFFETMAAENKNVKIINVLPTYIDTPFLRTFISDEDFDWKKSMKPEDVAEALLGVIKNKNTIESGSRIMIIKQEHADGIYNPEKLWIYTTKNKKFIKAKS